MKRMYTYGWLVWTKRRTWRLFLPRKARQRREKALPFGANRLLVPVTAEPIQAGELGFPVRIKASEATIRFLPPLIGILTSKHSRTPGFRGNHANFRDIIETGRKRGVTVFVFTPDNFHEQSAFVIGYTRHPQVGRWVRLAFPRPDVVYNRIPDREAERRPAEQKALQFFQSQQDIRLFNPRFFDKQELIQWFQRDHRLKSFLPATASWGSKETFTEFLNRFKTIYLKPAGGKAGKGIMQIRNKKDVYLLAYVSGKAHELKHYRTYRPDVLFDLAHRLTKGKPYLIQQGISLARDQGRPFDLRLLIQKDSRGQWDMTGLGIRVAGPRGITTHVPRGGSIGRPSDILPRVFASRASKVMRRARNLGLLVANSIERQSEMTLGELSIDLAVEQNGRLWLFEANAKPMKFDEPLIRKHSLERIIDYATYLTERRERGDHP